MSLLCNAPPGFGHAVDELNYLDDRQLGVLNQDVLNCLQNRPGALTTQDFVKLRDSDGIHDSTNIQNGVNALMYIFRYARNHELSAERLSGELQQSLLFTSNTRDAIKDAWDHQRQSAQESGTGTAEMFNNGQLLDVSWKLGVAISSDICRNINLPYVTVTLRIVDPSGDITTKTFEMNVPQFKRFAQQMREISTVLETV